MPFHHDQNRQCIPSAAVLDDSAVSLDLLQPDTAGITQASSTNKSRFIMPPRHVL